MSRRAHHLAIDLGAGNGRVMALELGETASAAPALVEVYRFAGEPVETPSGIHWNVLQILAEIRRGLQLARERFSGRADSLAIDSWGVDYALLDGQGGLLGNPFFYRDLRTRGLDEKLRATLSDAELFRRSGSQPRAINTIYQLLAEKDRRPAALAAAERLVFVPELIAFWLTGRFAHENTMAATSGLWDPATRDWNRALIAELGLPARIFHPLQEPGARVGEHDGVPVLLCASHDTASAIHAVQGEPGQAVLSLGSWAIVSWPLVHPGLHEAAGRAGFAVEGCPRGHWRYARNHTALWLLQRYRASLADADGRLPDFAALEEAAALAAPATSALDPDDPAFLHASDLPQVLRGALTRHRQTTPTETGAWCRLLYRSIAIRLARSLHELPSVTGEPLRSIRVIGGGARSTLLCQMISDAAGLPLVAGPEEATAWGNGLAQCEAVHGGGAPSWRARFAAVWAERRHEPRPSRELTEAAASAPRP